MPLHRIRVITSYSIHYTKLYELQEVSSIITNLGGGISQAIGTGGRDVKKEVGGLMFIESLKALNADEETEVIALVFV